MAVDISVLQVAEYAGFLSLPILRSQKTKFCYFIISPGIGHAVTEKLLSDGHRVVVMARTAGPLNEFKDKYPDRVQVVAGDITDPKVTKEAVETATKTWSRIDALAIIHGVLLSISPIADIELDEWRKTIEINTMSAISLVS